MFKPKGRLARLYLFVCMALCMSCVLHAQSTVTPEDEYKKLIRVSEDIQPLGATPFGEDVSLYNGSLSFDQTDISLAGNGPMLQLSRSFRTIETHPDNPVGGPSGGSIDGEFSDWDIDIPRITTLVGYHAINPGWQVLSSTPYARCSHFSAPPTIAGWQGNAPWEPSSWWAGYQLIVPGAGSQDLLSRDPNNTVAPSGGAAAYPIVTTKNWVISCGVQTDDETNGGEGFIAVAPDGTKYTLNHLIYRWAPTIDRPVGTGPESLQGVQGMGLRPMVATTDYLQRLKAEMLVTKVEDRFGNALTYHYDPNNAGSLISILGSDGRQLTLSHSDGSQRITAATLTDPARGETRTWQYNYDATSGGYHRLQHVILPDGTEWSFNLGILFANMTPDLVGSCDEAAQFNAKSWTGTITHPSGLTGSFTLAPLTRGRSYVLRECVTPSPGTSYASLPRFYSLPAIVSKTFTGAGLASQTWTYSYSQPNASWTDDACAHTSSCASTVWTDVLDPDGHDVRYTFSNRYDYSESQLLTTDYHAGNAASLVLRSETNGYAVLPLLGVGLGACPDPSAWAWLWPCQYGSDLQSRTNHAQMQNVSPVVRRTVSQDGDTYTWQAEAFNAYAQVTKAKRSNTVAGQTPIEEVTSYLNDTGKWVLGLPEQVTSVTSGEVESLNRYDADDNLQSRARFGQTLMSYTFNGAGQLASFTDGNGNQTTLGSYKRGISQAIHYPATTDFPAGTNETLVVDDFGQVTSLTDQAGHTTSYTYDPVGRVTRINYPAGDDVAWAPQIFTYNFVTSAERGVAANHWKRTATLGGANTVTYFDAMLRPVLSDSALGSAVQTSALTTYDFKGQKLFSAYPSASALTFSQTPSVAGSTTTYDALGRVTQVQQDSELGVLTTHTTYGADASQTVTDPKGNATTTHYQVFDEPSYDTVIRVDAPTGIIQTIARDVYGNPQSITQSGPGTTPVTKKFFYDSYYRLCRTSEPESGSEVMAYDAANNLAWSAAGLAFADTAPCEQVQAQVPTAARTLRTYDAMNRVSTILPPADTQSTTYHYDKVGRMISAATNAVSGDSTWSGTYNFRGMLNGESLQVGNQNPWAIGYAHDVNGTLSLIHYPDGENVSYTPDALGRPTQAGSYAQGVNYFANGQVKDFVFGNGATYVSDQCGSDLKNCRQLLSNFGYGHGGIAQLSEDLTYDKNGNITGVIDEAGGPRDKSFGYDALNRLTSATADHLWGTQAYTYDALNNLRTLQSGSQTSTYAYDTTNRLTSISSGGSPLVTYRYDTRGNVIGENTTNLEFDQKNQLTRIGATGPSYGYDAASRRVSKIANGTTTYYFYNHAGQLMYQAVPATMKSTNFIYLGTKMVARDEVAPTISSPAISATGNYTVSWTAFLAATSYNLQEQVNGGSWTTIQTGSATASAITGKSNGVYRYQVRACNASTCGSWSNVASTTVIFPPPTPASITIPATSSGSVAVSWAASSTATSYTLQHANYGITGWSTIYTGSATGYTAHETISGAWIYQVQACNAGGCSAYRGIGSGVTVTIPPASAPSLTVPATSYTGSYTVSWGGVTGATSYTLQEQVNGGSWATIQATSATSKALSGKGSGTYGYRVQGYNAGGYGPWSSAKTIAVTRIPAEPALVQSPSRVPYPGNPWLVNWAAVSGATSYTLQRTNTATNAVVAVYTGSATSTSDYVIPSTYLYAVKACNVAGCSGWRNTATDTTVFCVESFAVAKPGSVQPDQFKCGDTP